MCSVHLQLCVWQWWMCMYVHTSCVRRSHAGEKRKRTECDTSCVCVCVPPPVTGRGWAEHRSRSTAWQSPSKREKKVLSLWWINTHTNTRTAKIQHEHKEHAHPREGYTHRRTHTVWLWPVSPRASVVNISAAYIWSMQMETLPESLAKIFMDSICCGHSQPTHRVCLCGYTPNSPSCVCACVPGVSLHVCLSVCVFAFCMLECVCVCVFPAGGQWFLLWVCVCLDLLYYTANSKLFLHAPPPPPPLTAISLSLFPSIPLHLSLFPSIYSSFHSSLPNISTVISVTSSAM